jgi:molybdopterin synthase sulfur carrier subunit
VQDILRAVREMTMHVRVKLFATLSRHFGDAIAGTPFEIEAPDGATLADLVNQLKLPREEVTVLFVNGRSRSIDWVLTPGDEIGIFPLVAGG